MISSAVFIVPYMLGLFGYCFSVALLTRPFWRTFLIFYVVWNVLYYYLTGVDLIQGMTREVFIIAQAFGWLLAIPSYIALYLYGAKKYVLWTDT
jgi:hypothetical protein